MTTALLDTRQHTEEIIKYEKIKIATHADISSLEAETLADDKDDEILYALALNEKVSKNILKRALSNAKNVIVKNRIKKAIGEKNG